MGYARAFAAVVFLCALARAAPALAETWDWCALGESFEPGRETVLVRHVRLQVSGESLGELSVALSEEIIRRRLWPEGIEKVHVSPYVAGECGPADSEGAEFEIALSAEDLGKVREELGHRGDATGGPTIDAISRRASVTAGTAPAPANAEGKSRVNWVRLFFATNRAATGSTASDRAFGAEDADRISWGSVDVSIPHAHERGTLESPSIFKLEWTADPDKHVALAPELVPMAPARWKEEVGRRAAAVGRPGVLLFVHGYNVSFADGARRAAQFSYDVAFNGPTVYFSWPSDGRLIPYMHDEAAASAASELMADVLQVVTTLGPDIPVYVVAHSMGNRVMLRGLASLMGRDRALNVPLRQVVMAAPDIGRREFSRVFDRWLAGTAPRYTVYASSKDKPVNLSEWLHGDRRLGDGGPDIAVIDGVDSVDASALTSSWFDLNHSYFGDKASVLSDLFTLIHRGTQPSERPRLRAVEGANGRYWAFAP
jgi:esterase/lipase superfamily enzyme